MKPQCKRVLTYIQEHGVITQQEAADKLGCSRLAARIADLKSCGYRITKEYRTGKNRYGERVRFCAYGLEDN